MKELKSLIKQLEVRVDLIRRKKKVIAIKKQVEELSNISLAPSFWSNRKKAQIVMSELNDFKDTLNRFQSLDNDIQDIKTLIELCEEEKDDTQEKALKEDIHKIEKTISILEIETFLNDKFDKYDAIMTIYAGQGGTEACDWAEILLRMYLKFFEQKNWKFEITNKLKGAEAGISTVTFEIKGKYTYGYLKREHGTHRLIRVSPFNAQGLRQTSFAGVEVAPIIKENVEINLKDTDIQFSAVRSGGKGGQNVNKVSTSVRITHIPTGITINCSSERSQLQNREAAINMLRAKLYLLRKEKQEQELSKTKGEYKAASWGHQIRNYVLHPYKLVKDLRTGVERTDPENVLNGNLDEFIEAEVKL